MKTINLDGKWNLSFCGKNYTATVPGLDLIDLIDNGVVPEPNDAESDTEFFFISQSDKTYSRTFKVDEKVLESDVIELYFERLDTIAKVTLNGNVIGETANIHIPYSFNVKKHLLKGENTLEVTFRSLRQYIEEKQAVLKLPYNSNGTQGHPHIRKVGCHFGWDFGPELDVQGISGHCEIRYRSTPQISFIKINQKTKNSMGYVSGHLEFTEQPIKGSAKVTLVHPCGKEDVHSVESLENPFFSFSVVKPELWWCNGLGEQPLYTVKAEYECEKGHISFIEKKFGFREIILDTSKDLYGSDFQFVINGKRIFSKGANYIPMDALYTRITKDRLYTLLSQCKEANMNMIRVWGGGFYESEEFYDICDELGLLIWQDFAFACCAYPFMQKDFLKNVTAEVEYNVKRLMHRACLALWCGNNEIESMSLAWIARKDIIDSTGKFFYMTLPELIRKYDTVTAFHACTPSSGKYMKDVNSDDYGDTHIWNVWHGYQPKEYFRKRLTRFASEYGMQSYPTEGVIPHQKCDMGEERLNFYLSSEFTVPKTAKHKVYLTQLLQLEAMKEAAEHFRRNSYRCRGSLYWQLNDIWSSASWAAVDCNLNKKALMYASRHFYEPVHVSAVTAKKNIEIHLSSDLPLPFEGKAVIEKMNTLSGKAETVFDSKVFVYAFSSKCIFSFKADDIKAKEDVLILKIYDSEGNLISENRRIFCKNYKLNMKQAKLSCKLIEENKKRFIEIKSDSYARYAFIDLPGVNLSDNFFDLSENETKKVEIQSDIAIEGEINAFSLCDVLISADRKFDRKILFDEVRKPMALANIISRYFEK